MRAGNLALGHTVRAGTIETLYKSCFGAHGESVPQRIYSLITDDESVPQRNSLDLCTHYSFDLPCNRVFAP